MPQESEGVNWGLLVIIAVVFLFSTGSPNVDPDPKPPEDDTEQHDVEPPTDDSVTEADVWNSLAEYVEADRFGVLNSHTDHLILIVEELKATGALTNISRVDPWRGQRQQITAANRAAIAAQLRGR